MAVKALAPMLALCALAASGNFIASGDLSDQDQTGKVSRLKVVSYNAHHPRGERLARIMEHFLRDPDLRDAQVIALQEIDRWRKKVDRKSLPEELARAWRMNYHYAIERFISDEDGGGDTGVAILSKFPLPEPERIELPHGAPRSLPRVALGSTVELGCDSVRVYTLHLESKLPREKRREQLLALLERIRGRCPDEKIIVLGDFNTICERSRRAVFEDMFSLGFSSPLSGDAPTFVRALIFRLRTDWIFLRNLRALSSGVEAELQASDHRPIWVVVDVRRAAEQQATEQGPNPLPPATLQLLSGDSLCSGHLSSLF